MLYLTCATIWYRNGAPIPGALGATLKIENAAAGDAAAYTASAINAAGCVTSQTADLIVKPEIETGAL